MADLNEPKKETVRITLPPRTPPRPTVPVEKETARINLPNRPPGPLSEAEPPAANLRPPSSSPVRPPPTLVAPRPLPPTGSAPAPRPPATPLAGPPTPAPSRAVRPPKGSPPGSGFKAGTPPPAGLQTPLPPATPTVETSLPPLPAIKGPVPPPPAAKALVPPPPPSDVKAPSQPIVAHAPLNPVFPPVHPPENRGVAQTGPRKETARIADSPMKATVRLSGLQRPGVPSGPVIRTAPPAFANLPARDLVETVPTQLCWVLLGISALTLLIQLWTYFA